MASTVTNDYQYILQLLKPVLDFSFTNQELENFAAICATDKFITVDVLKNVQRCNGNEKLQTLISGLAECSKPDLKLFLLQQLHVLEKAQSAEIVECCFNHETRDLLIHLLSSWDTVCQMKSFISNHFKIVLHCELSENNWILDICCYCVANATNNDIRRDVVDMLQQCKEGDQSLAISGFEVIAGHEVLQRESDSSIFNQYSEICARTFSETSSDSSYHSPSVDQILDIEMKDEDTEMNKISIAADVPCDGKSTRMTVEQPVLPSTPLKSVTRFNEKSEKVAEDSKRSYFSTQSLNSATETQENTASAIKSKATLSLVPVMAQTLNAETIDGLAGYMYLEDIITDDIHSGFVDSKLHKSSEEKMAFLLSHVDQDPIEERRQSFLTALRSTGENALYDIVKSYYQHSNEDLDWMVNNWEALESRKDAFLDIVQKENLEEYLKQQSENWLLDIITSIKKEGGDDVLHKVVSQLSSDSTSQMEIDDVPSLMQEMETQLKYLQPLITSCLDKQGVLKLAGTLALSKCRPITKNSYQLLRDSSSMTTLKELFELLIKCLTQEAKDNWVESLLAAMQKTDKALQMVTRMYLEKHETMCWFVQNWDFLLTKKDLIFKHTHDLQVEGKINKQDRTWLVNLLHHIALLGDHALIRLKDLLQCDDIPRDSNRSLPIEENKDEDLGYSLSQMIEDTLLPLNLVITPSLDKKAIEKILKKLAVIRYLSREVFNQIKPEISSTDHSDLYKLLVNTMKNEAKDNWKEAFLEALERTKNHDLAMIVKLYLEKHNNVCWFVENWDFLQMKKEEFLSVSRNLDDKVTALNNPTLVQLVHHFHNSGDLALNQLVDELNRKVFPGEKENVHNEVIEPSHSKEIERLLYPLHAWLDMNLGREKVTEVLDELYVSENLSEDSIHSLKNSVHSDLELISHLFERFKVDAKESWKVDLIEAFDYIENEPLSIVMELYLEENQNIHWIVQNWSSILKQKDKILEIAENLHVKKKIDELDDGWLLHFIYHASQIDDDKIFDQVVEELNRNEQQIAGAYDENMKNENISKDIEESLNLLFPMLSSNLSTEEIYDVAKLLQEANELSEDSLKTLEELKNSMPTLKEMLENFVRQLQKDGTAQWKENFLRSLDLSGRKDLHFFLRKFYTNPNRHIQRVLESWEQFESSEKVLLRIAHSHHIDVGAIAGTKSCVLLLISKTLEIGDKALENLVVEFMKIEIALGESAAMEETTVGSLNPSTSGICDEQSQQSASSSAASVSGSMPTTSSNGASSRASIGTNDMKRPVPPPRVDSYAVVSNRTSHPLDKVTSGADNSSSDEADFVLSPSDPSEWKAEENQENRKQTDQIKSSTDKKKKNKPMEKVKKFFVGNKQADGKTHADGKKANKVDGGGKPLVLSGDLETKRANIIDEGFSIERRQRLKRGTFVVEFRAIVAKSDHEDFKDKTVYLYMVNDGCKYPMQYHPSLGEHRLAITWNSISPIEYKYLIDDDHWEFLPYPYRRGIVNRCWNIKKCVGVTKHVITFDVIMMETRHDHGFQISTMLKFFLSFLSSLYKNLQKENDGINVVMDLHNVFKNWLLILNHGFSVKKYEYGSVENIFSYRENDKVEVIANFLKEMTKSVDGSNRVLCTLAFVTAFDSHIPYFLKPLFIHFCHALSLHNVEDHAYLESQLKNFHNVWMQLKGLSTKSSSLLATFETTVECFLDNPGYLLVFPLLKLLQSIANQGSDMHLPPNLPSRQRTSVKWSEGNNQMIVLSLGDRILKLADRFPWISKGYTNALTLETIAKILTDADKSHLIQIFDIDTMLSRLKYYWKDCVNKRRFDENQVVLAFVDASIARDSNLFSILIQFYLPKNISDITLPEKIWAQLLEHFFGTAVPLINHLMKQLYQIAKNKDKIEVESCQTNKWIDISSDILNSLKILDVHLLENVYKECLPPMLRMFDDVILVAQITLQKQQVEKSNLKLQGNLTKFFQDLVESSLHFIQFNDGEITKDRVQLWNVLSSFMWSDEVLSLNWNNTCKFEISSALNKKKHSAEILIEFYAKDLETLSPNEMVAECFYQVLSEVVEKALGHSSWHQGLWSWSSKNLSELLWNKFRDKWWDMMNSKDKTFTEKLFLYLLEEWIPAAGLLKILCMHLDEQNAEEIALLQSVAWSIDNIIRLLVSGDISLHDLKILNTLKQFWECYDAVYKVKVLGHPIDYPYFSEKKFQALLILRQKELKHFFNVKLCLQNFVHFLKQLEADEGVSVDAIDLQEKLVNRDFDGLKLSQLVKCADHKSETAMCNSVEYFPIDEQHLLHIVAFVQSLDNSVLSVAKKVIHDQIVNLPNKQLSVVQFLVDVWEPVSKTMLDAANRIDDGSILLQEVKQLFECCENDNAVNSAVEFFYGKLNESVTGNEKSNTKLRLEQIHAFFALVRKQKVAETLKNIQEKLKLEGNFDVLQEPVEYEDKNLKCITDTTRDAVALFEDISQEKLNVLKAFQDGEMFEWLKTMKDIGEVKVMCDLAMISAGESQMDMDKVSCFLSAATGFSPLIFDLPKNASLNELLAACEKVWNNAERDCNLVKKWTDINKQLEWLKNVKELHGSVEKSSLTLAQKINTHGVYKIGGETDKISTVDNCLKLLLPSETDEDFVNIINLSDLRDLQSRLMLIAGEAGKGKEDVTKFIDLFSSAENLAKAYVKLKQSGCLIFNKWTVAIRCCNDQNHVTVEIYFDESSPVISSSEDVMVAIRNLIEVLEEAHQDWMRYLHDERSDHYDLNHFNIHQLMYLCKNLSCTEVKDFPDQVYQLLSCVTTNVSFSDISDCLAEVTRIDDEHQNEDPTVSMADDRSVSIIEKKKKLIRKLIQSEVTEKVAKAAVQCVKSLDIDDCYLWTLEKGFDEILVDEYERKFDEEVANETISGDINAIQDVINDRVNLSLQEVIVRIHENLESEGNAAKAVKTVCKRYLDGTAVTSLEDCISIEHLGQFLESIEHYADKGKSFNRDFPQTFHAGRANLVVCQRKDIWRLILSIYMNSPESDLPSADEVLVCSKSTTAEEIELLLRRAIQVSNREGTPIFCLACVDEIDFATAEEAENMFLQLNKLKNKCEHYRLVIFTSSLQHYLTACFYEDQIDATFAANDSEIKNYIQRKLHNSNCKCKTASSLDREQSLVRLVCSERAGMGKSLFVARYREALDNHFKDTVHWNSSTIRFLEKNVDVDDAIDTLTHNDDHEVANNEPHFVHIDITPAAKSGVIKFLFDLVILGELKNSHGLIWKRRPEHFYVLEYTFFSEKGQLSFDMLDVLPKVLCKSPLEVLECLKNNGNVPIAPDQIMMDKKLLSDDMYQRPYQYLLYFSQRKNLDQFKYTTPIQDEKNCLQTLLQFCSIEDPTWSELSHFSKFLNTQLCDCEESVYCNIDLAGALSRLNGLKNFAVRFMIRMSQDFATPSLNTNVKAVQVNHDENDVFEMHQLRRRWESGFHPYLFFNSDRVSMSFVHFNISQEGDLCHPSTNAIVESQIMDRDLVTILTKFYKVNLCQDFDKLGRDEKLQILCNVFGIRKVFDPDPTYELTMDNVLKMLAIQMRFRCGIPVIVMGETGCGKTRMIEFMSKLKAGNDPNIQNMVVIKVHGGITVSVIQDQVKKAAHLAKQNGKVETTLFLDEANTTEAIYAIKEIVCDLTVHGKPFDETGLKIVAACNPYRKHSEEAIEAMERPGLGFHVKAEDVADRFAGIPMRHLVYRVIELPPSMQPLVWDFGQLSNDAEAVYIKQMVLKLQKDTSQEENLHNLSADFVEVLTHCLHQSQTYMREKRDVCCFVSLRDVERAILSFKWFYKQLSKLDGSIKGKQIMNQIPLPLRAMIQALGMCYHVTLHEREQYRKCIANQLIRYEISDEDILNEIIDCQNMFLDAIDLEKDIGRNEALRENVFMMVVCTEMRIPLFLIGKPGSSKSLAKTIVTDAMQGRNSKSELFKLLKQIQVASFQCSAVSDAVGIERVFNQCASLQKNQNLEEFVAVVVLDEIGLAEDSPKMPLKVLHPLLENASTNEKFVTDAHGKVGFVGISNWALDPAKMNRGIFVTRGKASQADLKETAKAIFASEEADIQRHSRVIDAVTCAYLEIYENQEEEFFGLRDYYGMLKMIYALVRKSNKNELWFSEVANIVQRNFSGFRKDVFVTFKKHLIKSFDETFVVDTPVMELIKSNLDTKSECRFLLLLTNQYSAVSLLPKVMRENSKYQVVFGSSFPHDHDYSEVCRNINRIKVCMETGRTVVLLNLRDLYESLYDALNQHYVTFAGQRYVDLGLGGHRLKCRIHKEFRLVVIEEKDIVYDEFPIPLINRLEKHVLEMSSILTHEQANLVGRIKEWMSKFTKPKPGMVSQFSKLNNFPGYKEDTAASALLSTPSSHIEETKKTLIQTASLDSICRLSNSCLHFEAENLQRIYMEEQVHDDLLSLLQAQLKNPSASVFEVTSFSQILNDKDKKELQVQLHLSENSIMLLTLQQFQTERAFSDRLDKFFSDASPPSPGSFVLIIQCLQAQLHGNLIACAKYATMNKLKEFQKANGNHAKVTVMFLFTMERHISNNSKASFTSFHSPLCFSLYLDELKPSKKVIAAVSKIWGMTIPQVIERALENLGPNNQFLDAVRLTNACIPSAMANLNNEVGFSGRNRAKILNNLCHGNSNVSRAFLNALLQNVLKLLQHQYDNLSPENNWIVDVACSLRDLQEGGSFKHAVWLYLRKLCAVAIGKVICTADTDCNLDLVGKPELTDLWLQMFNSNGFININWSHLSHEVRFVVKTQLNFSCAFPFSRMIFDLLCKQWMIVEEQVYSVEKKESFLSSLQGNSVGLTEILDIAEGKANVMDLIKSFIQDLTHLMYKSSIGSVTEMLTVQESVLNLYKSLEMLTVQESVLNLFLAINKAERPGNAFVEIFCLFKKIKPSLELFSKIISVKSECLEFKNEWIEKQSNEVEFVIHKLAFHTFLKMMQKEAETEFDSVETCAKWKASVNKAKQIASIVVPHSDDEIKQLWSQILFVELFLDQLLPISTEDTISNYLSTTAPLARRLWKGARNVKDISSVQFMNITANVLQGCKKDIELRMLCGWQDTRCKACREEKMTNPVLLPCKQKHYICFKCLPKQVTDRTCPKCREKIPDGLVLQKEKLTPVQVEELKSFHSACISFFLEYLATFCFALSAEQEQSENLTEKFRLVLENLVICDFDNSSDPNTLRNLPVNHSARSYILQLLLRCDSDNVKQYLNEYICTRGNLIPSKGEIIEIYFQCMHSMLQIDHTLAAGNVDDEDGQFIVAVYYASNLLKECYECRNSDFNQLQHLEYCAKLQYIVRVMVSCIHKLHIQKERRFKDIRVVENFLKSCEKICKKKSFSEMRLFVVKEFCRQWGINSLDILLANKIGKSVIPQRLCPDQAVDSYLENDYLVLIGNSYTDTKSALLNISNESQFPEVFQKIIHEIQQSKDSIFQIMLALSVWTNKGDVSVQIRQKAYQYITGKLHTHLSGNQANHHIFSDIAETQFNNFALRQASPQMQYRLVELLSLFGATVIWHGESFLIKEFNGLAEHPDEYIKAFLPTMPSSNFFKIKKIMEEDTWHGITAKAFLCPNGHLYFIGDCTKANGSGKCPECRQPIGGQAYDVLHDGNKAGEITEESQSGYKLGIASQREPIAPERNLSRLSVGVLRICLHALMLLGSRSGHNIARIVKVKNQNVSLFLLQHLVKDIEEFSEILGKSIDDALIILYEIFNRMRTVQVPLDKNCHFRTMDGREAWENSFQRHYLALVFKDADAVSKRAQATIIDAGGLRDKPLARLVYELAADNNVPDDVMVEWNCPFLWKYRLQIDITQLTQKLEAIDSNAKMEGSILKTILHTENLNQVKHLASIIQLQSAMIKRYEKKNDMADSDKLTLMDYLQDQNYLVEDEIALYITVWNKVRHHIVKLDHYFEVKEYFSENISMNSPISVCLPSKRGRGRSAYVLVEYLANQQNKVLQKCRSHATLQPKDKMTYRDINYNWIVLQEIQFDILDASRCTEQDVICFNKNKDLMFLMQTNCQYDDFESDLGPQQILSYNISLLEKKVIENFFLWKSVIECQTLHFILYPQDVGFAKECDAILRNEAIKQVPLPARMCHDLDTVIENVTTDKVCEAVRTLTLVIRFLSKLGADADQAIYNYSEKELLIPPEEMELIPRSAQICHCLGLYERLSWHRSKRLLQSGQNPFENVLECAEDINDEKVVEKFKEEMKVINNEWLQLEINSLLMIGPQMQPDWRLGEDVLLSYLEYKSEADSKWCERIPEEVLYKHASHVFRISVHLTEEE